MSLLVGGSLVSGRCDCGCVNEGGMCLDLGTRWSLMYQPAALDRAGDSMRGVEIQGLGRSWGDIVELEECQC